MPDHMDHVQALADQHAASVLQARASRPRKAGRTHCEDEGCGEPISPERQAMGARMCVPCARAAEAKVAHLGTWGRR